MTRLPEIWDIIRRYLPNHRYMSLQEVYQVVERHANLDQEDYEAQSPGSDVPKWKRNVRNVLQYRKKTGKVEWDGNAGYKLAR